MDLNKKLEELKPYQLNCNVFDVYSYNGLTMQDLLCQFFTKINECITVSNETIDLAKWLVNEGLEIEVVKKLMIWLEDGTLENIINVNLFETLNDNINDIREFTNNSVELLNNEYTKLNNKKLNIEECGFIRPEWMSSWNETDHTQAFKDCISIITEEFKTKGFSKLHIKVRGNYTISSTLKFNSFVKIVSDATTQFSYTGNGYLFHIVADDDVLPSLPQICTSQGNVIDGSNGSIILKGLLNRSQTAIRLGEEVLGSMFRTSLAQTCISHVYIVNFDKAISFSSIQVFINRFFNVSASHCKIIIHDESNTQNAGELITWTDCSFHNSDLFLQSNGETFHEFKGCSVDYNKKGIQFNNNKVVTLRFTDCWIEGNAQADTDYHIETTNSSLNASVVFTGCQFHFGNSLPKKLNNGRVKVVLTDNAILIDRHNRNYPAARFIFMFDRKAEVISEKGTLYQYMVSMFSPNRAININQFMDSDAIGANSLTGYTLGGAGVTVSNERSFFDTKSVRIDTSSDQTYCDFLTEITDLKGCDYVYGNSIFFLGGINKSINMQYTLEFYKDDKTTKIGTTTFYDNYNYSSYDDGWFCSKWGTGEGVTKVPNGATHARLKVTFGNIKDKTIYVNGVYLYPFK